MIRGVLNKFFPASLEDRRVIILGLDATGKTSILYRLKLGEYISTIPTIGFNVESIPTKHPITSIK